MYRKLYSREESISKAFAPGYRKHPTESRKFGPSVSREQHLLDLQHLNVEDKRAVGWNARHRLAAIGLACGDSQSAFATNRHTSNANIPTLDDLAVS